MGHADPASAVLAGAAVFVGPPDVFPLAGIAVADSLLGRAEMEPAADETSDAFPLGGVAEARPESGAMLGMAGIGAGAWHGVS